MEPIEILDRALYKFAKYRGRHHKSGRHHRRKEWKTKFHNLFVIAKWKAQNTLVKNVSLAKLTNSVLQDYVKNEECLSSYCVPFKRIRFVQDSNNMGTPCRYGVNCNRSNPYHFFKYSHPPEHPGCKYAKACLVCRLPNDRLTELIAGNAKTMIRNQIFLRSFAWGAFLSAILDHLHSISKKGDREHKLYRGMKTTAQINFYPFQKVKLSSSYTSTSRAEWVARSFAKRHWRSGTSYLLVLTDCEKIPQVNMQGRVKYVDVNEEEVILPPGALFEVISRHYDQTNDMTIINMKAA